MHVTARKLSFPCGSKPLSRLVCRVAMVLAVRSRADAPAPVGARVWRAQAQAGFPSVRTAQRAVAWRLLIEFLRVASQWTVAEASATASRDSKKSLVHLKARRRRDRSEQERL
eukprot:4248295-Pleurochrysis_carterae.AAC.2